ncbi:MAG: flagellar protein FlbB [Bradyrhizobiaceae bacterium]|nr:flagellar protein FlbB [Bradyrhizobiaceae bacterium]
MGSLRLIPIVIFAATCLLALKTAGFMYGDAPKSQQRDIGTELLSLLPGRAPVDADPIVTGAAPEKKPDADKQAALPKEKEEPLPGRPVDLGNKQSPAERALIERLQERRQEIEARARDLEMRENLIKAAEKQLETRIEQLKGLEGKDTQSSERIKSLVIMYEAMGPKEAARIFDRLDPKTTVSLVNNMNPRKVSEILAKMQPESAERLTIELARHRMEQAMPATDLKRIEPKNAQ